MDVELQGVADLPAQRRDFHVVTQALSVLVLAPFLIYLATRKRELKPWERNGLIVAGVACIVVDGWLLYRYTQER